MSKTVTLNKFDGGHAEDVRAAAFNQCEETLNFDILDNPNLLQPYPDMVTEVAASGTLTDFKITEAVVANIGFIGLGVAAGQTYLSFYSKTAAAGGASSWSLTEATSSGTVVAGSLVSYKGYAYAIDTNGLQQLVDSNTITQRATQSTTCKPFVHPEDNVLYWGNAYIINKWDGTTHSTHTTLIPTSMTIKSITSMGSYLVIGCVENNTNKSVVYLWGRDMTLNTLQGVIDWGIGYLGVIENLDDVLVGISISPNSVFSSKPRLSLKIWSGGAPQEVKKIKVDSVVGFGTVSKYTKVNNRLYFMISGSTAVYLVAKNKAGEWIMAKDRYFYNGTSATVTGFTVIEDIMFAGFTGSSAGMFYGSKFTAGLPTGDYTATCVYKSSINPNMIESDRSQLKQLDSIQVSYTGATSGTTVVKYSIDASSMAVVIQDTNAAGEIVTQGLCEYVTGGPFVVGREFQFQIECTGGSKIKEIKYRYTVLNEITQ